MPKAATAGFRNAGWTMNNPPAGMTVSVHTLTTADGAAVNGFLYRIGQPDVVCCIMHPREFLVTHYLIPELLSGGVAVWTQTSRSVGSDLRLEHEIAVLDVAAGMIHLTKAGFRKIVLVGNSGGASLYGLYNQQALLEPRDRLAQTPGGRPTGLDTASLPVPDGMALIAPHPGQGLILAACIDPSVTDENAPLSVDPELNFLAPENGYRGKAESAQYSGDFIKSYRAAQQARVARLDDVARELIRKRRAARAAAKSSDDFATRALGAHSTVMTIWRTDADLRSWDLSIDPSARTLGSVWGKDPFASNYGAVGFGRFCTPEAWLSTWSGTSSKANLVLTARAIEQPCVQIEYSGDNAIFPSDAAAIFNNVASSDKARHVVPGDHHGRPIREGDESGRSITGGHLRNWIQDRFLQ